MGFQPPGRRAGEASTCGVAVADVEETLRSHGLEGDARLAEVLRGARRDFGDQMSAEQYEAVQDRSVLLAQALSGNVAIPDFPSFRSQVRGIFDAVAENREGRVADYIPQLAAADPEQWGVAVCSVSAQRFSLGDAQALFCVQSTSKPITYCMALELHGKDVVHKHIGHEPSGRIFNERILKQPENIPHNPLINAGAIMAASLVKMEESEWDRFDYVMDVWKTLSGKVRPGFQYSTMMGERATAARNNCLAWMMVEAGAFPEAAAGKLDKVLEAYFSWCSIELTCETMSVVAATLANGGVCPTTGERVFSAETVTNCLSLMASCGMYDFSGEFAFSCGFPAKSGVSGVLCVVIPGVCGVATFSPRLDSCGNSCRGIQFCRLLSERLHCHVFDPAPLPRWSHGLQQSNESALWWAASRGDVRRIRQLVERGTDLASPDYDGRTALHLAATGGHGEAVGLLLALGADRARRDRRGNTPLEDALRGGYAEATRLLSLPAPAQAEPGRGADEAALRDDGLLEGGHAPPRLDEVKARALRGELAIPNFPRFRSICAERRAALLEAGVDSSASVCSIDGQRVHLPESYAGQVLLWGRFAAIVLYCAAVERFGLDRVHEVVGREPSGENPDSMALNREQKPYNPLTMSGQLRLCALLLEEAPASDAAGRAERVASAAERVLGLSRALAAREDIRPSREALEAQREQWTDHATSLACMMRHKGILPKQVEVADLLDLFFQCRSLESPPGALASLAASLAAGGRAAGGPGTGRHALAPATVRAVLVVMLSCGLAERAGEFGFLVGLPARETDGSLIVVVPGLLGLCVTEPQGGARCGVSFCSALAGAFGLHCFGAGEAPWEPRYYSNGLSEAMCNRLLGSAHHGDLQQVRYLHHWGCDLGFADYDGRTAAHLAASAGHCHVLQYLADAGAQLEAIDTWGCTPLDDAQQEGQQEAAGMLRGLLAARRTSQRPALPRLPVAARLAVPSAVSLCPSMVRTDSDGTELGAGNSPASPSVVRTDSDRTFARRPLAHCAGEGWGSRSQGCGLASSGDGSRGLMSSRCPTAPGGVRRVPQFSDG